MATTATGTQAAGTGTYRTGIGTGMRPQPKQSPFSKLAAWWNGLTKKQRWISVSLVLASILVLGIAMQINKATAYVPLYENSLSADDTQGVSQALVQMGIPYGKSQDGRITIPPSKRADALVGLTKEGLPHHPFEEMPSSGTMGKTHEEFTKEQQLMLERDLTMVLRQFNEVADADVKLVIPEDTSTFFSDEKQEAKAAIVLKLKAGYDQLPLDEARSIVNLVAYSVPGLKPENVQLTDTDGKLLSDMLKKSKDGMLPDNEIEQKKKVQEMYESQIKQILDPFLGHGKYAVAVNTDLDWNQSEEKIQQVGNPDLNPSGRIGVEEEKDIEKFNHKNGDSGGARQLSYNMSNAASANADYEKSHKIAKYAYNERNTRTIVTPGQVRRLTVSVLADGSLSASAIRTLTSEIKNAVGMDVSRGDNVVFGTLPVHEDVIAGMSKEMNEPPFLRHTGEAAFTSQTAMRVIAGIAIAGIALIGLYLFRQQAARSEKSQLVLASGPAATVSEISDLLNDKTGKVTVVQPAPQKANQTEKLEQLAKEKPTRVAELLKTTWLAEK